MLCQNCGRRSSDTRSFCQYCGAVASPDLPAIAPARPRRPHESRQLAARLRASKASGPVRASRAASGGLSPIFFFIVTAVALAWLTTEDNWRSVLKPFMDGIEQPALTNPGPRQNPTPPTRPVTPAVQAPASPTGRRPTEASRATGAEAAVTTGTARRTTISPSIEGLTQDQVRLRLGEPLRRVTGGDGVTGWGYENGAPIVYFVK